MINALLILETMQKSSLRCGESDKNNILKINFNFFNILTVLPFRICLVHIFWPYLSGPFSTKYKKYGCLCKVHENVFSKASH